MAFASGPVSFRRFFIGGKLPSRVDDAFVDALSGHAFGKHGTATPDGTEFGWVTPEHVFDTDITTDKIAFDRFAFFQMRVDKTAPPSAIVRSYARIEEAAARDAAGKDFLNKSERKVARELAQAKAEKEAKAGLYRRISTVPVLIDLEARTIYLGNLGSAASDVFIMLFRDTFDLALESAESDRLAHRIMDAAGDPRIVEDAEPIHLVASHLIDGDNGFDFNDRTFFGREFLTWLWYRTDRGQGAFEGAGQRLAVMFARTMQLDCDFKMTGRDIVQCDGPAAAPESRAALAIGKQPTKAGLVIGARTAEFGLLLDGPKFTVSALRLPDPEQNDRHAILEERFQQITEVAGILDVLFGLFLGRRGAADWSAELAQIKAWASGKRLADAAPIDRTIRFPAEVASN